MALLTICNQNQTLTDEHKIREYLNSFGIDYERWPIAERVTAGDPPEKVLEAYAPEIEKLKASGGYVTADVIDVTPDTPGLQEMLAKFDKEHWHDEDEVRFVVSGRGIFHIHFGVRRPVGAFAVGDLSQRDFASTSEQKPERRQVAALQRDEVVAIEVTAGDLIRVPRGTFHWFNLCDEHRIRAIRLFQDKSGWTPHYTESYLDRDYLPLCFGPPTQG